MKHFAYLFIAAMSLTTSAAASTITTLCSPTPASKLGQSNSVVVTCNGFVVPVGATINSITSNYIVDITVDGFSSGSTLTTFALDTAGSGLDISGTFDATTRPVIGSATITSGFAAFLSDFTVTESYSGASTAVAGGTFNQNFSLDFTPAPADDTPTPEPASFALIGVGLAAFAFRRKA